MSLRLQLQSLVAALSLLFVGLVLAVQGVALRDGVREEVDAAHRVAARLLQRTAQLYAADGVPSMLAFLQGLGRVRSTEITLLDPALRELYRSPPSPYKAGREAPAWFAAWIAPPSKREAFEFSDGLLELRSNPSRATLDAWDAFIVHAGAAGLLLLALNLLLAWILDRTVRPFGRIVRALGEVEAGNLAVELPALPGREAATMAHAFNRMVARLREQRATEGRALRAEAQLSDSRKLARWVDQHIEQERRLIARELHDELGQSVTAMRSLAMSIVARTRERDPQASSAAALVAEEASRLYDAMHGLIPRLTPLVLDRFGLADALADLVERARRAHPGVAIGLATPPEQPAAGPDAALALYRAAQEGLTNALRHGAASRVSLRLAVADHDGVPTLELSVEDDGNGLPPESAGDRGHHGLRWMGERVAALGGRASIAPGVPRGAVLRVQVPLEGR